MELLQRRKLCREFLNGYNEKLHPQIISRVFEIGLLTLKKTFNKLLFSKEELDEVIKSLSGKEYVDIIPLPPRKKLEKLNITDINYAQNKEEDERNKIIKNQHLHRQYLQNPNFTTQNNEIYPFWWWNNEEEDFDKMKKTTFDNNINLTNEEINYDNNEYYNNNYNEENNNINEEEFPREEIKKEEMVNKIQDYSMKNLNTNLIKKKIENQAKNPNIKNNKVISKQRVKSTRNAPRNNNNIPKFKKVNNYNNKKNQKRKDLNLQKIPKFKYLYNNGRIVKVKEDNMNIMNLTEPNNKY